MSDLLRLLGGCVFLALAALTAVAPPNEFLWKMSIAATEGGHYLAIGALVVAIPWRGQHFLGKIGGIMSIGAAIIFALPLFYASQTSKNLPAMIDASFGTEQRVRGRFAEDARPEPLVMFDLVSSVQSRPVRLEEREFSSPEGEKLSLDIYKPGYEYDLAARASSSMHGGSWQGGSNKEFIALNAYLAARDYVVISIDYRLAPKWKFPAGRDDVLAAIAYLKVYGRRVRRRRVATGASSAAPPVAARPARRIYCQRARDPRRHLGLRADGSEVRLRPPGVQESCRHARRARRLSRRITGEGGRRILRGVADQLRDAVGAADAADSRTARRPRLTRREREARGQAVAGASQEPVPSPAVGDPRVRLELQWTVRPDHDLRGRALSRSRDAQASKRSKGTDPPGAASVALAGAHPSALADKLRVLVRPGQSLFLRLSC